MQSRQLSSAVIINKAEFPLQVRMASCTCGLVEMDPSMIVTR